jgi:hypothetical protein
LDLGNQTTPCCPSLHKDRDHIACCTAVTRNIWCH